MHQVAHTDTVAPQGAAAGGPVKACLCTICGLWWDEPVVRGRYPRTCATCDPTGTRDRRDARDRRARHLAVDRVHAARGPLAVDLLLEVADLVATVGDVDRRELRKAIVFVAHATGPRKTRAALLRLAAVATAWASHLPADTAADRAA